MVTQGFEMKYENEELTTLEKEQLVKFLKDKHDRNLDIAIKKLELALKEHLAVEDELRNLKGLK